MKLAPILCLLLLGCADPPIISNAEVIAQTKACEAAGLDAEISFFSRRGINFGPAGVHCIPRKCKPRNSDT